MENSDKIRCFVAVELPDILKNQIDDLLSNLIKINNRVKWVKSSGIHITLKFLGEIEASKVKNVENALSGLERKFNSFYVTVSGFGAFPNKNRPRVFWLGLKQDEQRKLYGIHTWIDEKLFPFGFEKEKRRFSPHLTVGRMKFPSDVQEIFDFMEKNHFKDFQLKVSEIILMRSRLKKDGAIYSPIKKYTLENKS